MSAANAVGGIQLPYLGWQRLAPWPALGSAGQTRVKNLRSRLSGFQRLTHSGRGFDSRRLHQFVGKSSYLGSCFSFEAPPCPCPSVTVGACNRAGGVIASALGLERMWREGSPRGRPPTWSLGCRPRASARGRRPRCRRLRWPRAPHQHERRQCGWPAPARLRRALPVPAKGRSRDSPFTDPLCSKRRHRPDPPRVRSRSRLRL